jgi:ribosome-binding factor A
MTTEETPRQKKIGAALQQEMANMLQQAIRDQGVGNLVLSVTKVIVTVDLSVARIYLSIFPKNNAENYLSGIKENAFKIKYDMARRMKNQLRRMPNFSFYLDDSLDYIEAIDDALNHPEDPINRPEMLAKRKKI